MTTEGLLPRPVPLGHARVHPVTAQQAADAVLEWARRRRPAVVVTPNVDHVVLLERDPVFRSAYGSAHLQLCDGMPLKVLASLAGTPVPARITGIDLFEEVCRRSAEEHLRVFVAGGMPDVLARGIANLRERFPGLEVSGHSPPVGFEDTPAEEELVRAMLEADPHVVAVCFGAPRSEVWAIRRLGTHAAVYLCVGAAIDVVAGARRRAPAWMQRAGLEWLFRLLQEPGRLWRRYLVRDVAFLGVAARHLRRRRRAR